MSKKHLGRYVTEFVSRHNKRPLDTEDQMGAMAKGVDGKRLKYAALIAPNGLESGARPQLSLECLNHLRNLMFPRQAVRKQQPLYVLGGHMDHIFKN